MFFLTHDSAKLGEGILQDNHAAGGVTTFEGRVRSLNEGQQVEALEYEAYDELAVQEGQAILEEAMERFDILDAACGHRVGKLQLGEVAVRVEVAAAHRKAAFDACEFIVDEVKRRVPIWKKEHYLSGVTGWINVNKAPVEDEEKAFYARQIRLPEVGDEGQEKLRSATVLVVGAGGLGSPALEYLAAAGVGTIGIAESDVLESSNLHRQPLYAYADRRRPKVQLAAERINALNPFITVREHPVRVTAENVMEIVQDYDLILDCTDNFATKFLLNDAAILAKKTLIQASIYQYEGQLMSVGPEGPCLRCLWPETPHEGCVGSCAEVGVLGVVPGVLGALQASEALKSILGLPGIQGQITLVDLLSLETRKIALAKNPQCPLCGKSAQITSADPLKIPDWIIEPGADVRGFVIVDIREPYEITAEPMPGSIAIPFTAFDVDDPRLNGESILLVCHAGIRSDILAKNLREAGHENFFSMVDGIRGLRASQR